VASTGSSALLSIAKLMPIDRVFDVFKVQGQPTITYVSRQNGYFEAKLSQALNSRGSVCVLTGPSKTGKTSLYSRILAERSIEALRVRCDGSLRASELWKKALEQVNFTRVAELQSDRTREISVGAKLGATLGWKWLAGMLGEVSAEGVASWTEAEARQRVLSDPGPEHLVPLLKQLPLLLVLEDFHYLDPKEQTTVFQQWKTFVDEEVSVLVVGTTHHAADLAHANKDLVGRVFQIDLTTWSDNDLSKIASEGFKYLNLDVAAETSKAIAAESVGLPIITQAVCLSLLLEAGITEARPQITRVDWKRRDAYDALHRVALERFQAFESNYDRLIRGPRKRARKFDTYELILSTFTLDPLVFSLKREEIIERLKKLPLHGDQVPPDGSLNSTFGALGSFQQRLGIEILEWSARDQRLYILEPAFLFYLRWRKPRAQAPSTTDLLGELIVKLGLKNFDFVRKLPRQADS